MHTAIERAALALLALLSASAMAETVVGQNTNAVGPTAPGFYGGLAHYQDNEPDCDRNSLLPSNIVCMVNGYNGADDLIGDAWPKILETQDNGRNWVSRYASGSAADPATDLGQGFGADPIVVCWPGGCGGFFIASTRAEGGGTGGGVYMEVMPELNIETGFRHYSLASGPRTVQLGTGDNFLDKIDAIYLPDTQNPGTISVTETVDLGNGQTREIVREWPRGRLIVVYASINSSSQNIRVYSTYSDDYGITWSPPRQVAQTTGIDTGVAVASLDDTVLYAYRQFADDSGDQLNSIFAAISNDRGDKIGKVFPAIENLCPFDQPTLPNAEAPGIVTSRTNNFVSVSSDGSKFVMVLTSRLRNPVDQSCFTPPFEYRAGSRVLVTTAGANGRNWQPPVEIAPRDAGDGPRGGHSFQFMPAVDCNLGSCMAIWYDSLLDSIRNLGYMEDPARGWTDAANAFESFPFFGDFIHQLEGSGSFIQVRRTADVFARQFSVDGNSVVFEDPEPVRVTRFQLARFDVGGIDVVSPVEQLAFTLRQYKGNSASFMGDYVGLASAKLRPVFSSDPAAPPVYEPNNSINPDFPFLKPNWFAFWTDTRNARGRLYANNVGTDIGDALPFEKSPGAGGGAAMNDRGAADEEDQALLAAVTGEQDIGVEGVEDTNFGASFCQPAPASAAGDPLPFYDNVNRIKDADIYGAILGPPATAWVLNATKGLGRLVPDPTDTNDPPRLIPLQRTYTIAARNEQENTSRTFRFRIMNQPVGFDQDEARASWLQLPFENFDNSDPMTAPEEVVDETVGPESSVTVALFVVSALPVNPVTVNVYEVDPNDPGNESLVETLIVNGEVEAGDLITPDGVLVNVNIEEVHNPFVYAPTSSEDVDYANPDVWNPDVWNPDVWNPDVWNPDVWNPDVWNPDVWNPDVWNPDVWNPDVWNPDVWNATLTSSDNLDNPEIPSPDLSMLESPDGDLRQADEPVAKFDIHFTALNDGNTISPYTADFAVNSPVIRALLQSNQLTAQIIVSQDAELTSFQACTQDDTGENRIIAVANNPDLIQLRVPDIFNNRFGSVTYYAGPRELTHILIRLIGFEPAIRAAAPEVVAGGISYVVTSQAANTGETNLDPGLEQAIEDNVPPVLTINASELPVPLTATRQDDEVGAILPAGLVTATKGEFENPPVTCDAATLSSAVPLGDFAALGLGESELTCSATSTQNNATGTVTFGVDVFDDVDPTLGALPDDQSLERATATGATADFTLPTATDAIDLAVDVACSIPGDTEPQPFPPGGEAPFTAPGPTTTTVTCTATDDSGNEAAGSFLVTVRDTTAPALTLPTSINVNATSPAGAAVTFSPEPAATDLGDVSLVCSTPFDADVTSGDAFPLGMTTVSCTATDDANNETTDSFDVTVADVTAPEFVESTLVDDFSREANTAGGANLTFIEPSATDFGQPIDVSCDADPTGDFYPLGDTLVTCTTATDGGGNFATTSFTITVVDTTDPVLTVLADITAVLGEAVEFAATADDVDGVDPAPSVVCDPPSGTAFPLGTTTVSCTATDASGNTDVGSFDVSIVLSRISTLTSNKRSVNSGAVIGFTWSWKDAFGNPVAIDETRQDVEARIGGCPPTDNVDVLNEDPGSSDIRPGSGDDWQFNWQTVDEFGNPIEGGDYCFSVIYMPTGQVQSTEVKVRSR